MPLTYRRPGVYLEESLLVNPADTAGTITSAMFVGVAAKGPINEPTLVESWSDFVTLFGNFDPIKQPDNLDMTGRLDPPVPATLAALQSHPTQGNGKYVGPAFTPGQFVTLGQAPSTTQAHYELPPVSTVRAGVTKNKWYATDSDINGEDATNAAKLAGEGFAVSYTVTNKALTSNVVTLTIGTHSLQPTDQVLVALSPGDAVFDGTQTITAVTATTISYAKTNANVTSVAANGTVTPGTATPATAWPAGDAMYIATTSAATSFYRFRWTGSAWAVADATATPNPGNAPYGWLAGVAPGTVPPKVPPVLSYLPYAVYSFFQNGGRFAWIVRSVDPVQSGTGASISVPGADTGAPVLTAFKLIARSVGTWGNTLKYRLAAQGPPIQVGWDPDVFEEVFTLQIALKNSQGVDEVVETWPSLSVTGQIAGTKRIDTALNDPGSGSYYVRATEVNSDQLLPVETDWTPFGGGIDPLAPIDQVMIDAADNILRLEGPLTLNICGYLTDANKRNDPKMADYWRSGTQRGSYWKDYGREDIFVVNDSAKPRNPNQLPSDYKSTMKLALSANTGDSASASYGPWIIIPDPSSYGSTIAVPPGGAIAGMMARIDATVGVFRAPAGVIAGLNNAVGVQTKFSESDLGELNSENINIVRSVVGAGICCMGGRTRKTFGVDRYVSARRTLIYIKEVMKRSTQFAVFENNDTRLWSQLRAAADRILRPLWDAGGLAGVNVAQAYYIRCDATLNTPTVVASGEVRMEVGVALQYPAEFVVIKLTQFDQGTFAAEIQPPA